MIQFLYFIMSMLYTCKYIEKSVFIPKYKSKLCKLKLLVLRSRFYPFSREHFKRNSAFFKGLNCFCSSILDTLTLLVCKCILQGADVWQNVVYRLFSLALVVSRTSHNSFPWNNPLLITNNTLLFYLFLHVNILALNPPFLVHIYKNKYSSKKSKLF